jgi:hypothetical protein
VISDKKELPGFYSGCQKNVPIAERFFATTLMPPSFYRNIMMTNGINKAKAEKEFPEGRKGWAQPSFFPIFMRFCGDRAADPGYASE